MKINSIVAVSKNGVIGKNNKIPWHISEELKLFKRLTTNHIIVMGRKTFDSIGQLLPNRVSIIISRKKDFILPQNTENATGFLVHSKENCYKIASTFPEKEVFVIGGAEIYSLFSEDVQKVYLSKINQIIEGGDAFFPELNPENWVEVNQRKYEEFEFVELLKREEYAH